MPHKIKSSTLFFSKGCVASRLQVQDYLCSQVPKSKKYEVDLRHLFGAILTSYMTVSCLSSIACILLTLAVIFIFRTYCYVCTCIMHTFVFIHTYIYIYFKLILPAQAIRIVLTSKLAAIKVIKTEPSITITFQRILYN